MSKRFLRWAEAWIEQNIPPGANPDIESFEAKAKRLSETLFAEAATAGGAARPDTEFSATLEGKSAAFTISRKRFTYSVAPSK